MQGLGLPGLFHADVLVNPLPRQVSSGRIRPERAVLGLVLLLVLLQLRNVDVARGYASLLRQPSLQKQNGSGAQKLWVKYELPPDRHAAAAMVDAKRLRTGPG